MESLREVAVDLVIVDEHLPGVSATEFWRGLDASGTKPARILLSRESSHDITENVVNELELDEFFRKPFDEDGIERRIKKRLEARSRFRRVPPTR